MHMASWIWRLGAPVFTGIVIVASAAGGACGWNPSQATEQSLQPQAILLLPPGNDPRSLEVGVRWTQQGWCVGQFQARVTETAAEVRFGQVVSRIDDGGSCAGVGTANKMAWADVRLAAPLGERRAIRDSDGKLLPILPANLPPPNSSQSNASASVCGSWSSTDASTGDEIARRYGEIRQCFLASSTWVVTTLGIGQQPGVVALDKCAQGDVGCLDGSRDHFFADWRFYVAPHAGGVTVLGESDPGVLIVDNGGHQILFFISSATFGTSTSA